MTQPTPRRDFLFGLSSNPIDEGSTRGTAAQAKEPFLIHLSRKAMAGEFEICLPVSIAGEATAAALEALDLVQAIERQLSFFQPESDISTINRAAADAAVEVEPRLFALLQAAMQLCARAAGPTTSRPHRSGKPGDSPAARRYSVTRATCRGPGPRGRAMGRIG